MAKKLVFFFSNKLKDLGKEGKNPAFWECMGWGDFTAIISKSLHFLLRYFEYPLTQVRMYAFWFIAIIYKTQFGSKQFGQESIFFFPGQAACKIAYAWDCLLCCYLTRPGARHRLNWQQCLPRSYLWFLGQIPSIRARHGHPKFPQTSKERKEVGGVVLRQWR